MLFCGQRIALRAPGNVVRYLHGDHLGSTVYTLDAGSSSLQRYDPFGAQRGAGEVATAYRYTGQRFQQELGLYDYGARWYDPALGRFIQPDTLVPEPGNPQSLNRYAYMLNNSLKYTDPTGHINHDPEELEAAQWFLDELLAIYGIEIVKDWGRVKDLMGSLGLRQR